MGFYGNFMVTLTKVPAIPRAWNFTWDVFLPILIHGKIGESQCQSLGRFTGCKVQWKMLSRLQKGLNVAELSGGDSFDHADSKSGFRFFLELFWLTLALFQDDLFVTESYKHTIEVARKLM